MAQRKPHRTDGEKMEDMFADMSPQDQAFELRMLTSLHRQKLRDAQTPTVDGQQKLLEEPPS